MTQKYLIDVHELSKRTDSLKWEILMDSNDDRLEHFRKACLITASACSAVKHSNYDVAFSHATLIK